MSPSDAERKRLYVGPVDDPEITRRVQAFKTNKVDYKERQAMVRSLVTAGLPATTGLLGDVVGAISRAGFFRLRGVLIGTVAFQAYSGFLGVRMPGNTLMTGDADFAQFHSISHEVNDSMPPIIDVLRAVDPTFTAIPHVTDTMAATKFRNAGKLDIEFLTPNRGSANHQGPPTRMPALGGASAEPLRFLDFLIRDPVRSVLLHKGGVSVTVRDALRTPGAHGSKRGTVARNGRRPFRRHCVAYQKWTRRGSAGPWHLRASGTAATAKITDFRWSLPRACNSARQDCGEVRAIGKESLRALNPGRDWSKRRRSCRTHQRPRTT
jgi:hypothetical protein